MFFAFLDWKAEVVKRTIVALAVRMLFQVFWVR